MGGCNEPKPLGNTHDANKDEWLWGYRVKLIVGITHLLVVERS